MKQKIYLNILALFISLVLSANAQAAGVGCAAGYDCSPRGVGDLAAGDTCGNAAWEAKLVGQESGGSYDIKAPNSSARGRYQFINSTRAGISNNFGLPCGGSGDAAGFDSCPGLQDDYFRALVQENMNALQSVCAAHCGTSHDGVPVTMSGLLAMAHNVGAACAKEWAIGGESNMTTVVAPGQPPCRDANGTNAVQKYAAAMGGFEVGSYASMANCGFGYEAGPPSAPYQGPGSVLACDENVLDKNKKIVDALNEVNAEIIKANIQQPTPVEQMTCLDQQLKLLDASGSIHATPNKTLSQSDSTGPKFGQLTFEPLQNELNNLFSLPNSINQIVNNAWNSIASAFNPSSMLGGIMGGGGGGGSAGTNCDVMEQTWLLNQCINMPALPSLGDIVGGTVAQITGAITSLPERMIQQVCKAANSKINGVASNFTDVFEDAANSATSSITDSLP